MEFKDEKFVPEKEILNALKDDPLKEYLSILDDEYFAKVFKNLKYKQPPKTPPQRNREDEYVTPISFQTKKVIFIFECMSSSAFDLVVYAKNDKSFEGNMIFKGKDTMFLERIEVSVSTRKVNVSKSKHGLDEEYKKVFDIVGRGLKSASVMLQTRKSSEKSQVVKSIKESISNIFN